MGATNAQEPPGRVGKGKRTLPVALLHCAWCGRPCATNVCRYCDDLPMLEQGRLRTG